MKKNGFLESIFINPEVLDWLLNPGEPWWRYQVLVDLLDRQERDEAAEISRQERGLISG